MLSEFYGDPQLTPVETEELHTLLSQLAGSVIYSTAHILEPAYRVQPGETLADIAGRYNVTAKLLAKINGYAESTQLPPGTELKVVRGPFNAILDRAGLRLVLGGRYAGRFPAEIPSTWSNDTWIVQRKSPQDTPSSPSTGAIPKQIVLAPSAPQAQAETVAIVASGNGPREDRPAVYVSQQDMDDLFDILTVGSRVTIRH
jgi:LysM repeat protein